VVPIYLYMKFIVPFDSEKKFPFISKIAFMILISLTVSCSYFVASNCIIEVIAYTDNNSSTTITMSEPTENYTNGTAFITEGPRQIITDQSATSRIIPRNQPGKSMPDTVASDATSDILNMNITKEQAAKAEQEANVMIKAYYEELEKKNEASALATAQPNQTTAAIKEETGCLGGEVPVHVESKTVCLSIYEMSIACSPGGSLVGDPICSTAEGSSIQRPAGDLPSPEVEQEVIDETEGQGQDPGVGEEEVLEEGDTGEQEVIEEFE
jgi:hypothetical protein